MGKVVSINVSEKKTVRKTPVKYAEIIKDFGIKGDAHAANWHRQVSFLAIESIEKMRKKGLNVGPGDFAENITTQGFDPLCLPIGSKFKVGDVLFEVTQHGKVCHTKCAIYYQAGDCVMPREGIFARALSDGKVCVDDDIYVVEEEETLIDNKEK
ncbi:MAG: MOSC domain-containing protein [Actinobacteria bacterium]|nr:MOSC domain-containing protein [Actinomycetota bacterium]